MAFADTPPTGSVIGQDIFVVIHQKSKEEIYVSLEDLKEKMKTIKQFSESKATEKGERDVGSKAYTDYVTDLTPGAVTNTDAKKSDRETKKTNALKIHRATRLDDATDPEVVQANSEYQRAKDQLRKQHIKNVADIRSNKIG